jgi:NitT/TauT family transport system substrate-binding protein
VITRALQHVSFSVDPHADTFQTLVQNGIDAGTQKPGSIDGLFDLRLLNAQLAQTGQPAVSAAGLGQE